MSVLVPRVAQSFLVCRGDEMRYAKIAVLKIPVAVTK